MRAIRGYIQKRGPNTYRIFISLGKNPVTGKYDKATYTFHGTEEQADAYRIELLYRYYQGENLRSSKTTFGEYLDFWLKSSSFDRPRTEESYRMIIEKYVKPYLGNIPLSKLSSLHIQEYFNKVRRRKGTAPLSPDTIHSHYRTMKAALNQAVKWGILSKNPIVGVKPPKRKPSGGKAIPPEDLVKLLSAARRSKYYELYLATVATGMRQGELLGLRWEDVDLERGVIHVRQTVVYGGKNPSFGIPKTDNSQASIKIPMVLVKALKELKKKQEKEKEEKTLKGEKYQDYGLVFATSNGTPIIRSNLTKDWKAVLKRAGLPDMKFHDLRHSHTTWLLMAGVDVPTVARRIRDSIQTTLNVYAHVLEAMDEKANKVVEQILEEAMASLLSDTSLSGS